MKETVFHPASIAQLDEPVRRYLEHALAPGASLAPGGHHPQPPEHGVVVRHRALGPVLQATVVEAQQVEDLGVV